jgi:hypothetical protein
LNALCESTNKTRLDKKSLNVANRLFIQKWKYFFQNLLQQGIEMRMKSNVLNHKAYSGETNFLFFKFVLITIFLKLTE